MQVRYSGLRRREKARLSKEVRPTQQLLKITRASRFLSLLLRKHSTLDLFPFQVSLAFSSLCNFIVKQHPVRSSALWLLTPNVTETTWRTWTPTSAHHDLHPTSAHHKKQTSLAGVGRCWAWCMEPSRQVHASPHCLLHTDVCVHL